MTTLQRLHLEQSELREALSKILDTPAADRSDEDTANLPAHTARLREMEPEIRAAIAASPGETGTVSTEDAEARERRELRGRVQVADHVSAAMESRNLDGAALEFNQALGLRATGAFPLELLAPEVETRANDERQQPSDPKAMAGPALFRHGGHAARDHVRVRPGRGREFPPGEDRPERGPARPEGSGGGCALDCRGEGLEADPKRCEGGIQRRGRDEVAGA